MFLKYYLSNTPFYCSYALRNGDKAKAPALIHSSDNVLSLGKLAIVFF